MENVERSIVERNVYPRNDRSIDRSEWLYKGCSKRGNWAWKGSKKTRGIVHCAKADETRGSPLRPSILFFIPFHFLSVEHSELVRFVLYFILITCIFSFFSPQDFDLREKFSFILYDWFSNPEKIEGGCRMKWNPRNFAAAFTTLDSKWRIFFFFLLLLFFLRSRARPSEPVVSFGSLCTTTCARCWHWVVVVVE